LTKLAVQIDEQDCGKRTKLKAPVYGDWILQRKILYKGVWIGGPERVVYRSGGDLDCVDLGHGLDSDHEQATSRAFPR
jgi:hypothetical protein